MSFTDSETKIINRIQKDVPLVKDPFSAIGDELNLKPEDVRKIIKELKERRVIRNIAGIFNATSLGYDSSLVAMSIPDDSIEKAVSIINSHPGVSHNYQRDHELNIWFTLAETNKETLKETVEKIAETIHASKSLIFENEKLFKIGLMLAVGSNKGHKTNNSLKVADSKSFTEEEKKIVLLLQQDLPVEENPFQVLIDNHRSSLSVNTIIDTGNRLKNEGFMRRYSAVVRHMETGYTDNAMTAWKPLNGTTIEEIVEPFKDEPSISHLYQRTVYPGIWEHPLFAMIHGRNKEELQGIIKRLSEKTGITDYLILRTTRELKKEKVIYFSPQFEKWKNEEIIHD